VEIATQPTADGDQRHGFRYDVSSDRIEAVLSDGNSSLQVVCADRSAGGFGLHSRQAFPWPRGQILTLNLDGSVYHVQVRHVERQDGYTIIGVQWTSDWDAYQPFGMGRILQDLCGAFRVAMGGKLRDVGIGAAILLAVVVFAFVVAGKWKSKFPSRGLADSNGAAAVTGSSVDLEQSRLARSVVSVPTNPDAVAARRQDTEKRIQSMLSRKQGIKWSDLEEALHLTKSQSQKFLLLLQGGDIDESSIAKINTAEIVIDSRKDFAAYLRSLPPEDLFFLSGEQHQDLYTMLRLMARQ
jgi:hypothetical protein